MIYNKMSNSWIHEIILETSKNGFLRWNNHAMKRYSLCPVTLYVCNTMCTFSDCFNISCFLIIVFNRFDLILSNLSKRSVLILVIAWDSDGIFGMSRCSMTDTVSLILCFAISVSNTAFCITFIFGCISWTTKSSNDLLF